MVETHRLVEDWLVCKSALEADIEGQQWACRLVWWELAECRLGPAIQGSSHYYLLYYLVINRVTIARS